ncbi:uncharacterized protein LOC143877926 [Tasmannia lanceolata]|uniref:uncharacterized protein LOC143877926 n=1 Tax=Tasmannia lanceolata TaxID=3420 RepID=UPI004063109F
MVASCFSLTSFYGNYLRRSFISAGLEPKTISIDGGETTMHCWTPKSHGKPPLILIHGFGPSAYWQWRYQVKSLSSDFDLYVPDLIFFGKSTTLSKERSEVFQAVSVGKLMEKLGIERFSVIGTSYGGFVSYNLARMYPERVEKVVIASSGINKNRRDNEELLERAKVENIQDLMLPSSPTQLRTLFRLSVFKPPSRVPDFLLNDVIHTLFMENREQKLELLMGFDIGKDDNVQISPLQQEVLIVWGEHDKIFPLEKAYELKKSLGEKVRLEVMKNTSHVPQNENPTRFNDIVKNFLMGSPKSSL